MPTCNAGLTMFGQKKTPVYVGKVSGKDGGFLIPGTGPLGPVTTRSRRLRREVHASKGMGPPPSGQVTWPS